MLFHAGAGSGVCPQLQLLTSADFPQFPLNFAPCNLKEAALNAQDAFTVHEHGLPTSQGSRKSARFGRGQRKTGPEFYGPSCDYPRVAGKCRCADRRERIARRPDAVRLEHGAQQVARAERYGREAAANNTRRNSSG